MPGANHFFENKIDELGKIVGSYVDERMSQFEKDRAREKERERERELQRARQRELERLEATSTPAAITSSGDDDDE